LIDSYGYKLFVNITTYVRKHKCCYIGSPYEIPPHGASLYLSSSANMLK